jgi:hypothetical protein
MKRIALLLFTFIVSASVFGQRTIQMRNIWTRPQVYVFFEGYTIAFTIKDIDKALQLLYETGDTTFGTSCGLDTAKTYTVDLFPGLKMEYRNRLQFILQRGVGAFLLTSGRAYIENAKHKPVRSVICDLKPLPQGAEHAYIIFTDPRTDNMLFAGAMAADVYNKDLGLD